MKATITYEMRYEPHPWNDGLAKQGVRAWCLVKVTRPAIGPMSSEPVALFDRDSEAEVFQGHVLAESLDGQLLTIDPEVRELYVRRDVEATYGTGSGRVR